MSSPDMNLPIPGVGITSGPQWATDVNSCLTIIDSHDHSAGYGVQITPSGININSDFPLNQNNLVSARSLRMTEQTLALSDPTDIDCLYDVAGDLYFNDGSGNQIQITDSGGIAGTPGSIANLTSPASASYVAGTQTFVWQSDVNKPANMDAAAYIFRNLTTSSFGVTVSPPNALGSNYSLVLPLIPASQKFMTLDASGSMSAPWAVDNSTVEVSSNTVQVKDLGITTAKIATSSVTIVKRPTRTTGTTVGAGGVGISADFDFTTSSTSYSNIEAVTITTTGRPVTITLIPHSTLLRSALTASNTGAVITACSVKIVRGATNLGEFPIVYRNSGGGSSGLITVPGSSVNVTDFPTAGTYTYTVQFKSDSLGSSSQSAEIIGRLIAYEWD